MPEMENLVTTCPLCLGADEVSSMLMVEIYRDLLKRSVPVPICRSCAGAVVLAIGRLGEAEATALLEMHCQPEIGPLLERLKAASRGSDDD